MVVHDAENPYWDHMSLKHHKAQTEPFVFQEDKGVLLGMGFAGAGVFLLFIGPSPMFHVKITWVFIYVTLISMIAVNAW